MVDLTMYCGKVALLEPGYFQSHAHNMRLLGRQHTALAEM